MIIDGFIFYNELDLLEMRLEELYPVVDKFMLVQASMTFRGAWKEAHFNIHDPRWDKYRDKIWDKEIMFPPIINHRNDPWEREEYQRNEIGRAIKRFANSGDKFILSDVDEIPRREVIAELAATCDTEVVRLETPMYYYGLNVRQGDWGAIRFAPVTILDYWTCQQLRERDPKVSVQDAGWHFSYLGDDEFVGNKLRSFSHSELDRPDVHANLAANRQALRDPYDHGQQLRVEQFLFSNMPHHVKENPEFWRKYIW